MFLSLPAVYLLESKSLATLYIVCAVWCGAWDNSPLWILSAAALAPFLILQLKNAESNKKAGIYYISVLCGALLTFVVFKLPSVWVKPGIKFLSCAVLLLALDILIKRLKKLDGLMPLSLLSCLTVIVMLMVSGFSWADVYSFLEYPESVIALLISVIIYAAVRFYKQKFYIKQTDIFVLCAALCFPMFWVWSNILLAALGIWFIVAGVRSSGLKFVNCGMLLIIFVIIILFFDSGLGLMERGIAFVAIGTGFILTNLLLYKKWRAR